MGFRLDDAGACDEEEPARADLHRPDFKGVAHKRDCKSTQTGRLEVRNPRCEREDEMPTPDWLHLGKDYRAPNRLVPRATA